MNCGDGPAAETLHKVMESYQCCSCQPIARACVHLGLGGYAGRLHVSKQQIQLDPVVHCRSWWQTMIRLPDGDVQRHTVAQPGSLIT